MIALKARKSGKLSFVGLEEDSNSLGVFHISSGSVQLSISGSCGVECKELSPFVFKNHLFYHQNSTGCYM